MPPSISTLRYINYPQPKEIEPPAEEAGEAGQINPNGHNPVISGITLPILAAIIERLGFVQNILWNNADFYAFRKLKVLEQYPNPCHIPCVIPTESDDASAAADELAIANPPVDTAFYSSADFVKLYLARKATPSQVIRKLLEIIAQPSHQAAITQVLPEVVLAAAEASSKRYATGRPLGPLDGVPIVVKDEVYMHDYETTFGSAKIFDNGQGDTAWCVWKLEEAGAIVVAKTAMHECGSDTTNCNPVRGKTPRNPYNSNFYTGGSSGGSAYCVSAGLVPIAVGCDGGGSIRIPSNYCGIYGLKPSHGRVSSRPTPAVTPANGVTGPMAATLEDLKIAYRVMAAPDPGNTLSSMFPTLRDPSAPLTLVQKKAIGVYWPWFDDCSPAVHQLVLGAVRGLEKRGYEVVNIPKIPYLSMVRRAHSLSIITDMAAFLNGDYSNLSPHNRVLFTIAGLTPAIDIVAVNKIRDMMMSHFAALWEKHPGMILVNPVTPEVGAEIQASHLTYGVSDADSSIKSMKYVSVGNFIGTPGITSIVGYDEATKMPVSLMGMAEWGKEEDLLGWATEVARASGLVRKKPDNWVDVLSV
ncbi:hypothetical protein DRE_01888 [Drechslerella stenobrocha 248]|uniref:Amidase domain-containing protein n=1 Tax=Drechslerella stenobrocha 248 TaxID=1043628 RepID=W7HWX4_9PEZI|nr:hypothetical protein DRE_01888 [Drechslerella stenobrocha 248]